MGHSVDRQVEQCEKCGGRIEVDTVQSPGEGEDAPPSYEYVRLHVGSCFERPSEEVVPGMTT